jgi:hypothetical protein
MRPVRSLTVLGIGLILVCPLRAQSKAPYSAEFKTTTVRTLANGTTITHEITGRVARDSAGRTYREETREVDPGDQKFSRTFITIGDSAAFEFINLNPGDKTATIHRFPAHPNGEARKTLPATPATSGPSLGSGPGTSSARPVVEKLGTKDIDGVTVYGSRITRTILAGQDGNDQPLVITTEQWLSPELGMELEREIDDPRNGVTKTEYSNIQRGEPDSALFRIPEDYAVKEVEQVNVAH